MAAAVLVVAGAPALEAAGAFVAMVEAGLGRVGSVDVVGATEVRA